MGVTFYTKLQLLYLAVICILIEQTCVVSAKAAWGGYNPPPSRSSSSLSGGLTIVTPPSPSRGTQQDPYATTGGGTAPGASHNRADNRNDGTVPENEVYYLPRTAPPSKYFPKFELIENEGQREDFNFQHYVDGNVHIDWGDVVLDMKRYLRYYRLDAESEKCGTLNFTDNINQNDEISSAEDTKRSFEYYKFFGGLIAVCRLTVGHHPIKPLAPYSKYGEENTDIHNDQLHKSNFNLTVVQQYVCHTAKVSCIQHVRDEFKHKFYLVSYSQGYLDESEQYITGIIDWKMYNDAKQQVKAFRGLSAIAVLYDERYSLSSKILEGEKKEFFRGLKEKFIVL